MSTITLDRSNCTTIKQCSRDCVASQVLVQLPISGLRSVINVTNLSLWIFGYVYTSVGYQSIQRIINLLPIALHFISSATILLNKCFWWIFHSFIYYPLHAINHLSSFFWTDSKGFQYKLSVVKNNYCLEYRGCWYMSLMVIELAIDRLIFYCDSPNP